MRLVRLFFIILFAALVHSGWAQTAQEEPGQTDPEVVRSITIFPNPATDWVHVKVAETAVEKVTVTLHNILGGKMEVESEKVDDFEVRIKVKDLASGYYFLAVKVADTKSAGGTYKFVKR